MTNISHDLRTPITSLAAHLETLSEHPERLDAYLPILSDEMDCVSGLIDDLFELSRLDARELELDLSPRGDRARTLPRPGDRLGSGSGLGLAIVKGLVEAMGGAVDAANCSAAHSTLDTRWEMQYSIRAPSDLHEFSIPMCYDRYNPGTLNDTDLEKQTP